MVICHFPHLGRQNSRNIITNFFFFFFFFFGGGGYLSSVVLSNSNKCDLFNLFSVFILFQNARSQPFHFLIYLFLVIKVLKNQSRWSLMWLSVAQLHSTWLSVAQVVPLSARCVSCCSKRSHRMGICSPMYGCWPATRSISTFSLAIWTEPGARRTRQTATDKFKLHTDDFFFLCRLTVSEHVRQRRTSSSCILMTSSFYAD